MTTECDASLVLEASLLDADESGRMRAPAMTVASNQPTASDGTYTSNALDVSADETEAGEDWTLRLREADEAHLDDL